MRDKQTPSPHGTGKTCANAQHSPCVSMAKPPAFKATWDLLANSVVCRTGSTSRPDSTPITTREALRTDRLPLVLRWRLGG